MRRGTGFTSPSGFGQTSGTPNSPFDGGSFTFADSIDLKEALGLFAFVASNFASLGVEKSFFHKAADALALIDLYQKRNPQSQESNRNSEEKNQERIKLKDIELGFRAVGTVFTIGAALYSAFAGSNTKEKQKR